MKPEKQLKPFSSRRKRSSTTWQKPSSRMRILKGAEQRRNDYRIASALTHQPKLARILRDWDTDHVYRFLVRFLNSYGSEKENER